MKKYRDLYYTYCREEPPNKGGFFVQIYLDNNLDKEIDNMVIYFDNKEEMQSTDQYVEKYIDERYDGFLKVINTAKETNLDEYEKEF